MFHYLDFVHDATATATQNGFWTHLPVAPLRQLQQCEHSHWIQCNSFVVAKNHSHSCTVWTDLKRVKTIARWRRFIKNELTLSNSDIMRSTLKLHLMIIKTSQNVQKICFWIIWMTLTYDLTIDLVMFELPYVHVVIRNIKQIKTILNLTIFRTVVHNQISNECQSSIIMFKDYRCSL